MISRKQGVPAIFLINFSCIWICCLAFLIVVFTTGLTTQNWMETDPCGMKTQRAGGHLESLLVRILI